MHSIPAILDCNSFLNCSPILGTKPFKFFKSTCITLLELQFHFGDKSVPFWGQNVQSLSIFSPKRGCSTKRVMEPGQSQ